MEAKSSSQMGAFFYPMFANCVHASMASLFTSELEFVFSPNRSKFALECAWNNKISQSVHNLGRFGKIDWFFSKKNLKFLKSQNVANFF